MRLPGGALVDGVTQADVVTGPYDVIVRAKAENMDDLGTLVVAGIQTVQGVTRTLTCPALCCACSGMGHLP